MNEPEIPEKMRQALHGYSKAVVFVPPSVDAKVLEQAKAHLANHKRRSHKWPWPWWAAAAGMIIGFVGWSFSVVRLHRKEIADIEGSGVFEMFAAFALARKIEAGATIKQADIHHDGTVDSRDVAIIAQQAVRLQL